jgi:hypothetical protein
MADILTAFTTAIGTISGDIFDMMGAALPVVLGITGAVLAVTFGIKFVKRFAKG